MNADISYDVAIIGGSYAGLSAAMALGRSLRNVVVVDSGKPCNMKAPLAHNFVTYDGVAPASIIAKARKQVMMYPTVRMAHDMVTGVTPMDGGTTGGFVVHTTLGQHYSARKLLFATGVTDVMLDIPGFAECWGITVLHCPYCHGYEVNGQPLGVIANGVTAFDMARLISNWSPRLTIFTNGISEMTAEQMEQLRNRGIAIVETPIHHLNHDAGHMYSVGLVGGEMHMVTALFARSGTLQHSDVPEKLGCALGPSGLITIDEYQQTTVPGIYAAGDNSSGLRALSVAIASGTRAGALINHQLIHDSFEVR